MARAQEPASPAHETLSLKDRLAEDCPLTVELAAFVQSGVSIVLASVGQDRRPIAGVALACTVNDDGVVRVILSKLAEASILAAIEAGGAIAVTFSRPTTHRSIQLKARSARILQPNPRDIAAATTQSSIFRNELVEVDHSEAFADHFVAHEVGELTVLEFRPEAAFVQTPGPGAGARLG